MGCVNGVQNDQDIKNQIKKMVKTMRKHEEKINQINQKFLLDLQKMLNPDNYQIDEQVILVVENKSECETISSQVECCVKKEQNLIQNYQQQIVKYNEKVKPLVEKSLQYIKKHESIQQNIEFLLLNQYIKKFQQNGFSYKIITIQQINQKEDIQINNLDNVGTFCESVIIQ